MQLRRRLIFILFLLLSVSPCYAVDIDTFNRADNVDLGTSWDDSYTSENNLQIVGNAARATVLSTPALETYNAVVGLSANQYVKLNIKTMTGAVQTLIVAMVRSADSPTNTTYFCETHINDPSVITSSISMNNAGAYTQFVSSTAETWVGGDELLCTISGTTLRMLKNGVQILTTTDGTIASGKPGFYVLVAAGGNLANAEVDTFETGTVGLFRTLLGVGQ